MFNKQMKKFMAIMMSAAMVFGAATAVNTIATQAEEGSRTTLALAEEETEEEKTDAAAETAEETEAAETFETLETTKTDEKAISAIDISDIVEIRCLPSYPLLKPVCRK